MKELLLFFPILLEVIKSMPNWILLLIILFLYFSWLVSNFYQRKFFKKEIQTLKNENFILRERLRNKTLHEDFIKFEKTGVVSKFMEEFFCDANDEIKKIFFSPDGKIEEKMKI